MALTLRWGTVTAVAQRLDEIIRCDVDGKACIAYPRQIGPVELGDTVLVNTQGRDLDLGSGGFDIVLANLTRGLGLLAPPAAHVMALPYTPQGASRSSTHSPRSSTACRLSAAGSTASSPP